MKESVVIWWGKTLNVLRAFAMSCILPVMQSPWDVINRLQCLSVCAMLHPKFSTSFVVKQSLSFCRHNVSHLVHAGDESGDGLFAVAKVSSRYVVLELFSKRQPDRQ